MEAHHLSVRTGLRLARDELASLDERLNRRQSEMNGIGRFASSVHIDGNREICTAAYREASRILVQTLIQRKGDRAKNRRGELESALKELCGDIQHEFDEHDGSPLHPRPVEMRRQLDDDLSAAVERIMLDFDEGVYHMPTPTKPGGDTFNIHAPANIAIAKDGSILRLSGGQSVSIGVTEAQVLAELDKIERALRNSVLPSEEIDRGLDSLVNARRELQAENLDAGRLRRFLNSVADVALRIGIATSGGVFSTLITALPT